jgi:hypothetical protein
VYVDPVTACPAGFAGGETLINAVLDPGTGCTGCSCRSSIQCSTNLSKYPSGLACSLGALSSNPPLIGPITMSYATGDARPTASCLAATFSNTTPPNIGVYLKNDGACTPQGIPTRSTPSWAMARKFCSASNVGAGCSQGQVCVPRAAPNHCALAPGAQICPTGYTNGSAWYTGFTDTRACGACSCGTQTAGSCASLRASFYSGTTVCNAAVTVSGTSGQDFCSFGATACQSAGFGGTPTLPTCPASSTVTGSSTPTGDQTLCCF